MILNIIYCSFSALSFGFLQAWTGVVVALLSVSRNIIFEIKDKYCKPTQTMTKFDYSILIIYEIATIITGIFTYAGFVSLFSMISMMIFTYAITQKNTFVFKLICFPSSLCFITYNILLTSYFGAILESIVVVTVILGIIKDVIYYKQNNIYPFTQKPSSHI